MRRAALLLLLAPALAGDFDRWIEQLDDPLKREAASRVLVRQGTPALPELRDALARAQEKEARERLAALIAEIEEREPFGLRFNAGMPKMKLTLDLVNGGGARCAVSVRNRGTETVVLWPYVRLRVLDATGAEVEPALRQGRWGLRRGECYLEEVPFVTLAPGKTWSIEASLVRYVHDPDVITGWQLPAAGTYTLEFRLRYDRAAAKRRCDPAWGPLDDPDRPWNRALEIDHVFRAELRVD